MVAAAELAADSALTAGTGDPPAPGRGSGNTAAGLAEEAPTGQILQSPSDSSFSNLGRMAIT